MIVRDKPTPFALAFAVRGSIVPVIAPGLLMLAALAALVVFVHHRWPGMVPELDGTGFTVFGIALSLFLGFRNNAAYERWWEARKLWGGLLADLRSFARELDLFEPERERRQELLRLALAFLHLHRANLRKLAGDEESTRRGARFLAAPNPPDAALNAMAVALAKARADGAIDGFGAKTLAERLASMALAQAGCERIANTPLPYVYSLLIYRTTYLYCLLLPLALVGPVGWFAPVFVAIVGYVFLGLAEVTEDLAHPFGMTPNALPLDAICRSAEISIAPHLGEEAPPPLAPRDYYLS
ncbi:bestrophin family protein [Aurantiacibacter flavus]|uniref:Bestrophin family ion channel n=1 Tax=Aurantiacibacter flavus TaxID=3145232 RepID=A0ABV0CYJ3_9SPHN